MFAVAILKLAGDIRFELMMTISKTVALGQLGESPTNLVEQRGFEPLQNVLTSGLQPGALPLRRLLHILKHTVSNVYIETHLLSRSPVPK